MTLTRPPMLSPEAATKDMAPAFYRFMGIPYQSDDVQVATSLREFAQAPADEPWVYSCLRRNFLSMQQVPLRVRVKQGRDLVDLWDTKNPAGDDLQLLLDNINDRSMNGADFRGYTAAAFGAWGGSYWKKVRGRLGGPPQELYWLPAPDVTPKKDPAVVTAIESYGYRPMGTLISEEYRAKDVLAFRGFNIADPTQLLSPLSAGRYDMAIQRQATMQAASVLNNWSIPAGAWVAPKGEEISPQDVSLIKRTLRALRGPRGAGKTPVLPGGLEWKPLALNPKDAEWLQARKVSRLTICGLLGVPLLLAGDDESTGPYAYAREIKRWYWENTVVGIGNQITDTLNGWLVPDFDPTRKLVVEFDYRDIEALKPTVPEQHQYYAAAVDRRAVTVNEYRATMFKLPPVPWGDEPELSTRLTPETGQGQPAVPSAQPAQSDAAAAAAALGKMAHLYAVPEVAAFQADPSKPLDTAFLGVAVSESARKTIETGIRRRYSAVQIAEGVPAEKYAGLASKEAPASQPETHTVMVTTPIQFNVAPAAAPQVTVNVPEQAAPVVNVAAPVVNVAPPAVTVAQPPAPNVSLAAPNVTVNMPRKRRVVRDESGQITGIEDA